MIISEKPNLSIAISDGLIVGIGPFAELNISVDTEIIDGTVVWSKK